MDSGDNFEPVINLSNNSGDSSVPEISISGIDVYVAWQDTGPGSNDIFFIRSEDRGSIFDATQNISDSAGVLHTPQLASSAG